MFYKDKKINSLNLLERERGDIDRFRSDANMITPELGKHMKFYINFTNFTHIFFMNYPNSSPEI